MRAGGDLYLFSAADPYIRFAAWVALGAGVSTVILVFQIITLRRLRRRREQRRREFLARWRPLVYEAMSGAAVPWPPIAQRDTGSFLWFWNQLQETVRGEAKDALTRVAAETGVNHMAERRLASRAVAQRLLALVTLGNMRDPRYWSTVQAFARDPHVPVALAAAQALIRIDDVRAVRELMPLFAQRADLPVTRTLALLGQVAPAAATQAIAKALPTADDAAALRLVEFVAAADAVALQGAMVERLRPSRDPQMWANVLRHLNDPVHLGIVRQACDNPTWFVRVQAVNALGRMGGPDDVALLVRLLGDAQWWVRYRAAEALLKLPFLTRAELQARVAQAGPEALSMIDKVAAREAA